MDATGTERSPLMPSEMSAPRRFLSAADLELEFGDIVEDLELGFAPARAEAGAKTATPALARLFSVFG